MFTRTFFTNSQSSNPTNDFFKFGVEKLLRSNYQEAIQDFSVAIKQNIKVSAAYSNRCLAYLQLEDYQNAIADCNEALNFTPNNVEAYLNRGLAHHTQGEYQAAILKLQPTNAHAYFHRGIAYHRLGHEQASLLMYFANLISIGDIKIVWKNLKRSHVCCRGIKPEFDSSMQYEQTKRVLVKLSMNQAIALIHTYFPVCYWRMAA
ncbi:tetratricopeptide repeat protein [Fischerella thermalis]|uniref:tetratricopeptide repeat protein n=1 Tax=Fischerella thermalis TaxID=372787 RepID=UPI00215561E7|nr:tetratricopeptide repeat protein [Fischerella thermalis]